MPMKKSDMMPVDDAETGDRNDVVSASQPTQYHKLGETHRYLGHFSKSSIINVGHNDVYSSTLTRKSQQFQPSVTEDIFTETTLPQAVSSSTPQAKKSASTKSSSSNPYDMQSGASETMSAQDAAPAADVAQ